MLSAGENGLKMRGLFLSRHDADFNFPESRVLEPAMQIAGRETEPAVAIDCVRFLETMLQQIENHYPAAAF